MYIADRYRTKTLQLPIPLEEVPSIKRGSVTEQFVNFYGEELTTITGVKSIQFSINTWIPKDGVKYTFQKVKSIKAQEYINLIQVAIINKQPLEVIICEDKGGSLIDGLFFIDNFEEGRDKIGNTTITLDLVQYKEV
ncbi:hypothetical protein [Clostridium botulinum]|uniref:hypothetical protein n=1 Tax=Clostridium botulinum TaxID=1491 RepID=UPI001C9BA821|nr:hypothetical protein [Clostridium botulinum]MBY6860798.1 hypothetical protein [Clostridium botulinum]